MKVFSHQDEVEFISDDSRECTPKSAFLLTQSSRVYEAAAREKGCKLFLEPKDLHRFLKTDIPLIGVTGTNGKTTTSAAIYSILLDLGYKVALLGTRGFFMNDELIEPKGLTTPPLLELYERIDRAKRAGCDFFVMEVSSHAIDQKRIEGLNFALKILTNITSDHLDYHKSLEHYIQTKNSFFDDSTPKLINKDESKAKFNLQNALSYGIEHPSSYHVKAYSLHGGIEARIAFLEKEASLSSSLFGKHNLYNLLAAISAVHRLIGGELQEICDMAERFGGVEGRMERVSEEPLVVVDFAHTEDGMRQIFESFPHQEIVVLFGAGGDRDRSKRPKMGAVADRYAKRIYLTSDNPRSEDPLLIIEEIEKGIHHCQKCVKEPDRVQAIRRAVKELEAQEVLLILGKGDEAEQIIGSQKIPMKDRETVLSALGEIRGVR
ncbi:MAG: UDP-N-acetylmuramoyl-L-alanyl-D-glutamate--2,6-diaminopimelate ligase [Wolinella succinogenes]|uniref:UDP-N-acetylmuramoyl-L-alanyl-D-glutamate--2, 6-diaminopimelate ligase n=1 Tax=Wolinella succinogenes TaxID=844 RepID=UPI001692AFFD|nr:UDP-N-acetylmuramoyl-L-alanyl-D-glutamate--2,6-diaminopimelate ligase [Wolinella succinogenes]NLU34641.1 UDP-N-acetylmuramoyl-L-alanyl-D-glutamate--2,6-diaminopimelate ligase [Wolinella succinogenes]